MLAETKSILFATDLSKNSDHAMGQALSVARAYGAQIHVLHVAEPLSQDAVMTMRMFMQDDESREKAVEKHRQSLKGALKGNQKHLLESLSGSDKQAYDAVASVELVSGHPAETILKRAKELKCDLIVMGTHEQSTGHTFLGTVVKRVLRRSPIPTLVVPHSA